MYIKLYNTVISHDNAKVRSHLPLLSKFLWMKSTRFNRNQHLVELFQFIPMGDEVQAHVKAAESIKNRGGIHL